MNDNPITAAADETERKIKGVGPYIKAHWKELLALVLAAIPAAFIVFHHGARQAAQQTLQPLLDAVPGGAGSPGTPAGPSGGGDPGSSIPSPVVSAAQAAAAAVAPSSSLGISVNGSNPIVGQRPASSSASGAPASSGVAARSSISQLLAQSLQPAPPKTGAGSPAYLQAMEAHDVKAQVQSTAPTQASTVSTPSFGSAFAGVLGAGAKSVTASVQRLVSAPPPPPRPAAPVAPARQLPSPGRNVPL